MEKNETGEFRVKYVAEVVENPLNCVVVVARYAAIDVVEKPLNCTALAAQYIAEVVLNWLF